ncbi:MAG: YciI family protein [Thermomicrobiales bacterium]
MKYMLILFGDASHTVNQPYNLEEDMAAHDAFSRLFADRGGDVQGEALQDQETAKSIRKHASGEFLVTDGPFVELKEQIGGYYLFDAADIGEAVEMAKQCPIYAGHEVRPVVDFSNM